jgi:hypothetical protein
MQTENTNELAAALAKAQGAMEAAKFDKQNPHFKNKYASLAAVIEAIRKPLSDNGLSYTQTTEIRENGFVLLTTLRHASGQWIASEYPLPVAKGAKDDGIKPQEMGSALSYARRYSLSALVCISSEEDDDAEGARKDGQTNSKPPVYARTTEEYNERTKADLDRAPINRVEPPVHPVTGETGPHTIVEDNDMKWGAKFVAAIKAAKDDDEINDWKGANWERLDALELNEHTQRIHDRIITNIETASEALKRNAA